ncbi:MAG TPA: hypothetical protein DCF65_12125 [Chloroflexi bacterium]|jgi:hypothetical protein|nr:hypothetical protein [Chloroflexota bacterium]HAF20624.1 hypothetical protein [Chloroflexota bacterium]
MSNAYLHQTVAVVGAFEFLRDIEARSVTSLTPADVLIAMEQHGVPEPSTLLGDLLASNILQRWGERIVLTTFGIKTLLLLEAVNGADVREVYRRLSHLDTTLRMYELVREGMTTQFLRSINDRPGFARLYFCSPWIGLDDRQQQQLVHAVVQEERHGHPPELLVLTRESGGADGGLDVFRRLGATIMLNPRLHTKLYIREPGQSGGYPMAIVGSQNLTRSRYLELGIRINADGVLVDQLIAYFWELSNASELE